MRPGKVATAVAWLPLAANFNKHPDTKSEEFYLKDEPVKVEKRNERPHRTVIEAMVGGWVGDGSGAVSPTSALTTGHPLS